jgi:hypothetical protein
LAPLGCPLPGFASPLGAEPLLALLGGLDPEPAGRLSALGAPASAPLVPRDSRRLRACGRRFAGRPAPSPLLAAPAAADSSAGCTVSPEVAPSDA